MASAPEIERAATLAFFEGRGRSAEPECVYSRTMYQDDRPDLVRARDAHEKATILPRLEVGPESRVVDVGCGVGRWADALVGRVSAYLGVDFSPSLLAIAEKRFASRPEFVFQQGAAEDVGAMNLRLDPPFDVVILSGVLAYLTEDGAAHCLSGSAGLLTRGGRLYLREPVARERPFTLSRRYSEELGAEYSAKYRTVEQYRLMLESHAPGLSLRHEGEALPTALQNRRETSQHFFVLVQNG